MFAGGPAVETGELGFRGDVGTGNRAGRAAVFTSPAGASSTVFSVFD